MKIASLLAAGTEFVCALGAGEFLVGRSHECDNPSWVKRLPALTAAAFDTSVTSRQIDAEVNRRLRAGESLYCVDQTAIGALEPDLIITQSHCPVCAVSHHDLTQEACQLPGRTISLQAGSLAGIERDIRLIADALNRHAAGQDLIDLQRRRQARIHANLAGRDKPTVVVLEWIDPLFAMGNWGPELIDLAQGQPLLGNRGQHSRAIEWSALAAADPEVLIIAPCGFSLERTRAELPALTQHEQWHTLQAVRNGRVFLADGNLYFNRSGTSLTDTVDILAEILHGYANRFMGIAWEPLTEKWNPPLRQPA